MQTGDCAGFGEQPNAKARRLLSRALWAGGLAFAGSVLAAASASAAEADQVDEPSGDLLGSLTSTVEPVTGLAGSLVAGADTLPADEPAMTENLLGDLEFASVMERPIGELVETVPLGEDQQRDSAVRGRAAERNAAATDRNRRPMQAQEAAEGSDDVAAPAARSASEPRAVSMIGTVDRLLTEDVVPDVAVATGEFTSAITSGVLGETGRAEGLPFSTQAVPGPVSTLTGLVTLLDLPLGGAAHVLGPVAPLLAPLDPVVGTAVPGVGGLAPWTGPQWRATARPTPAIPSTLAHAFNMSADAAPRYSLDETGAVRSAGGDGESAVIHSSLDAGTGGQDPSDGTRGGLRPSLLVTPVAGLTALHVGAPGAATSVDQAGPSGHALLPEEAVLRARLFSAAAYARGVDAKPLREANDPPVSPD